MNGDILKNRSYDPYDEGKSFDIHDIPCAVQHSAGMLCRSESHGGGRIHTAAVHTAHCRQAVFRDAREWQPRVPEEDTGMPEPVPARKSDT